MCLHWAWLVLTLFLGFCAGYIYRWRGIPFLGRWKTPFVGSMDEFTIGIAKGQSLEHLQENACPILSRHDVTDIPAKFVADPFLFFHQNTWHMFMEILNGSTGKGEIGLATSQDARNWSYRSIVLREPFHMSYPYVFEHKESIWMIPETAKDNSVRLYRATSFPTTWKFEKTLLSGKPFTDASIFQHNGMWWMFTSCNVSRDLLLYVADALEGPWQMHPRTPIVYDDPGKARCAGRVVTLNGKLVRFAQNCKHVYGQSVQAFHIDCLDKKEYSEVPLTPSPLLYPAKQRWRAGGMHHIDIHSQPDHSYLAAVDGWRKVRAIGLKY